MLEMEIKKMEFNDTDEIILSENNGNLIRGQLKNLIHFHNL